MSAAGLIYELLRAGRAVRFRAVGASMCPTIRSGDVLTAEPLGGVPLRRGEIALCRQGDRLRAHRVVGAWTGGSGEETFVLRGDNNPCCDRPVAAGEILGRVSRVERGPWRRGDRLAALRR